MVGILLSSLLCHWLVGRAGRRGSWNVLPLVGALKWVVSLAQVDSDGGYEIVGNRVKCIWHLVIYIYAQL